MLGLHSSCLPFPRGTTLNRDSLLTLDDTMFSELEGTVYEVPDTQRNTGIKHQLMIVKNDTGGAITVARKFCEFSTTDAYDMGRRIGTFPCATEGGVCVPLDDAYTVGDTIAQYDLFYVVIYGFVSIATQAVSNFSSQMGVCSSALGVIRNLAAPTAGYYVVGALVEAASWTANSTAVVGVDCRSLKPYPAAG